jgi:fumarylacetoacetate (FAA) hydrolase
LWGRAPANIHTVKNRTNTVVFRGLGARKPHARFESKQPMKLGTLKNDTRDGALCVVSRDLKRGVIAFDVAPTLQAALDDWDFAAPRLAEIYEALNRNNLDSRQFEVDFAQFLPPLPRAFGWLDGFAYPSHQERLQKARESDLPKDPQGRSPVARCAYAAFVDPTATVKVESEDWGIDVEAKLGAITGDVPTAVNYDKASGYIRLFTLIGEYRLRNFAAAEGEGALRLTSNSTWTSFAPVAVTQDEFGDAWDTRKVKLPILLQVNGTQLGRPHCASDMAINFPRLIAHAARTHSLGAGTIVGSGTISNKDPSVGFACIAEKRAIEMAERGQPETPYLQADDQIRLEMTDLAGQSVFGPIAHTIVIGNSAW